jgi:hypothetical protein
MRAILLAVVVVLVGCGGGDPADLAQDEASEHIPRPVDCNVQPRPPECL